MLKVAQFVNFYKMYKSEVKSYRTVSKNYIIKVLRDERKYKVGTYRLRRSFMIKKRESYRAVAGSIRSEWLRGLSRKICIGALAFSAAVVLLPGGKVEAYASDQTRVSSDESQVTIGYDDLDDTLQKGGLGVVVEQQHGVAALASTYDATALEKLIVEGIKAWQTNIDVSGLGLTSDDIDNGAVRSIINSHPEFISLSGGYRYWTSGSTITQIEFAYLTNAKEEQQELDAALQEVKSKIDISGMTDEEIVLAYHEYLTSTVAYAYEDYFNGTIAANHGYDMYGALVKHSCVCQGYAETMFYLLREAGLSCAIASSENINHAWNIVKIRGNWYHIDATWDDPVWDMPGRSYHDYFLVSFDTMNKNTLINHTKDRTDMVVSAQWGDTYTTAVDTTYESGKFWNGIEKAIFYKDGYWYSISEGSSKTSFNINKYQYSTNINKVLYSGTAKWTTPSGGYYPGVYSSIYLRGDNLYFTTPDSLNKIDITSTNVIPTELINIRTQYNSSTGNNLYAFGEQYGRLVYFITDSPNIKKTKDSSNSSKYNKEYAEYTFEMCISHKWDAGVVTKEPTYTSTGTKKYTCTNCGETKTETIAKLACTTHVWDNGTVTKKATYTATGVRKYTCKTCGAAKQVTIAKLKLTKVTVKAAQQTSAVKLTWNRSAGASGYKIYRRTAKGRYVCIKTVKSGTTSYVDKTVKSGNRYYYCVKAYNGNVLSGYTEASILYIKAPVVTVRKSAQGVKLSWKKSAGAKKYIVYRKTPTGKYRAVKTATAKTLSWTDKTAKKGQTYYYIVKAVNNKTYSAASPQKRIKR